MSGIDGSSNIYNFGNLSRALFVSEGKNSETEDSEVEENVAGSSHSSCSSSSSPSTPVNIHVIAAPQSEKDESSYPSLDSAQEFITPGVAANRVRRRTELIKKKPTNRIDATFRALSRLPKDFVEAVLLYYDNDTCNNIISILQQKSKMSEDVNNIAKQVTTINLNSYTKRINDINQIFECFKNVKNFTMQRAGAEKLRDQDIAGIVNLVFLQSLNLSQCERITSRVFVYLERLPDLKSLNLKCCRGITNAGFDSLSRLSALTSLHLSYCGNEGAGLVTLAKHLPDLRSLDIGSCYITGAGLGNLANFRALRSVDLSNCSDIRDEDLTNLPKNLQSIELSNCLNITDRGLANLVNFPDLQSLNLSGCWNITDTGLAHLVANLKLLKFLNLSECPLITDKGLAILTKLKEIRHLDLSKCIKITGEGVSDMIINELENLQYLCLNGCTNITTTDIYKIIQERPLKIEKSW